MARLVFCALALLLARLGPLAAQDDRWQVTLDADHYIWDIQLVRLEGDSLVVRQSDSLLRIPIARMTELRLIQKTEVDLGAGVDPAAGGAMAALTGGDDEVYDLTPFDLPARRHEVAKVLRLHPSTKH